MEPNPLDATASGTSAGGEVMFYAMMGISITLSVIGTLHPGDFGFTIFGIMFYIIGWQCLYMHRKYT